jgi:nitrous oxidase accessory protein
VTAPDVVIEGLIVRDSGDSLKDQNAGIYLYPGAHRAVVRHCDLTYNLFGLWIEKADDVLIEHNLITGKRDYDRRSAATASSSTTPRARASRQQHQLRARRALRRRVAPRGVRATLHHSRYGTHYMNSYYNLWEDNDTYYNRGGLALMEVRDQVVRNNRAWGNSDHGIMLRTIQDSVIENNVVAGNHRGFFIYDAEYNKLRGNLVVDNVVGVHLSAGLEAQRGRRQRLHRQPRAGALRGRARRALGRQGGNHWSNYLGWDRDGDGVGDVPYEANDMVDRLTWRHPMMKLLLASPAVQALRLVGQQFPVLRVPSVVDPNPRMQPSISDWSEWRGKHFPGQ